LRRQAVYVLQLALDRLHLRAQVGNARLELIDRVVERLDLGRELGVAGTALIVLRFQRRLQGVDRSHHLVHVVGVLLHQVDQHAHALVV
jgi:hypothetical protein